MGPTLFLIFINDIDAACQVTGAHIKKFADDTKCYQIVESDEDRANFQAMLDNLTQWSTDWQMLFNVDKCHILHIGKKILNLYTDGGLAHLRQLRKRKMLE